MFYSQPYLRKNGRFGLVWLAATKSKVLSRRELAAVNISVTVNDILEHIPGQLGKDAYNRPRRFSLYLSSQLMFGTVTVLQKQWEFLLSDITSLMKRFYPDVSSTNEIDLIVARAEPVTLESCVPTSIRDKHYDPFFGVFQTNMADIEALLATWDEDHVKRETVELQRCEAFKAELGSPHSVSDVRQISIQEVEHQNISISSMVPHEQDLPCLDADNLALIQSADAENLALIQTADNLAQSADNLDLIQSELPLQGRPVEETPAAKTAREQPGTPQKQKRKRRGDGEGGSKKQRSLEEDERGETSSQASQEAALTIRDGQLVEQQMAQSAPEGPEHPVVELHQGPEQPELHQEQPQPELVSPEQRHSGHDWLQKNPKLQLTSIAPSPSPVRKRQPHRLMIDPTLQLTRDELKQNMTSSSDTCVPLALPTRHKEDFFKEPGSSSISHPSLKRLWTRNCKFGLRVFDTDESGSSEGSSHAWQRIRKENLDDYQTPAKVTRTDSMQSGPASMERGRDINSIVAANESRETSKSLIAQASDSSTANISADPNQISVDENLEQLAVQEASLGILQEELELTRIPSPLAEIPRPNITPEQPNTLHELSLNSPERHLFSRVHEKAGQRGNWTTFRTICPPGSTSKMVASRLFIELCFQVAKGTLQVRQDDPYGEIYMWMPDDEETV